MHLCNRKWRHCCLNLQDATRAQGVELDGQKTTYWLKSVLPLSIIPFTNMCWCVFVHRGQHLWGERLQWGQHLWEWLSLLQTNWRFEDSFESIADSHYDLLLNYLVISIWSPKYSATRSIYSIICPFCLLIKYSFFRASDWNTCPIKIFQIYSIFSLCWVDAFKVTLKLNDKQQVLLAYLLSLFRIAKSVFLLCVCVSRAQHGRDALCGFAGGRGGHRRGHFQGRGRRQQPGYLCSSWLTKETFVYISNSFQMVRLIFNMVIKAVMTAEHHYLISHMAEKDANQMQQYTKPQLMCQLWLPFNIKSTLEKRKIMISAKTNLCSECV